MDRRELETLFHELERESARIKNWADNTEFQSGSVYGLRTGDRDRDALLEATAAMARAAEALQEASLSIHRLISP